MSKGEKEGETPSPPDMRKKEGPSEEQPAASPAGDEEEKGTQKGVEKDPPSPGPGDGAGDDVPDPIEDQPGTGDPPVDKDPIQVEKGKGPIEAKPRVKDEKGKDGKRDKDTIQVEKGKDPIQVEKGKDPIEAKPRVKDEKGKDEKKDKDTIQVEKGKDPIEAKPQVKDKKGKDGKKDKDPIQVEKGKGPEGKDGKGADEQVIVVKMPKNIFPARLEEIPDRSGSPTREEILKLLLEKHARFQGEYNDELKTGQVVPAELIKEKDDQKRLRDELNEGVSGLKAHRGELKSVNKGLRRELFDLMRKEERLKSRESDVKMYSKFCEDTEWKLETEAIDLETERRLLNDLRATMDKMRAILDGLTPDEMSQKLVSLDRQITDNSIKIEESHQSMLGKVEEANKHHDRYLELSGKIKEMEGRRSWLKRRIELHKEMEKFWHSQEGAALDLDKKDASRKLRDIKESLERTMSDRDRSGRAREQDGGRGGSRRGGNRNRKGRERKPVSDEGSDKREVEKPEAKPTSAKEDKPKPTENKEDKPISTDVKEQGSKPAEAKEDKTPDAEPAPVVKPEEANGGDDPTNATDEKTGGDN